MLGRDPVLDALERWEEKGLLDPAAAGRLRTEALAEKERSGRRISQYALAMAGGVVLLVAVGVLAAWMWPKIDEGAQTTVLAAAGILVHVLGMRVEDRDRWRPVAYALQTAGLLVLVWAILYSVEVWEDGTPGALAMGLVSLATPLITGTLALRRNAVMPAVHVALLPMFMAGFVARALPASEDQVVWIVDAVMAVVTFGLLAELARTVREGAPRKAVDMRLWAFTVALYVGFVMVALTAMIPLELSDRTLWAIDAWWVGMTALTLWAVHRAPDALRRDWYTVLLAAGQLLAIPFVFGTCLELLDWESVGTGATLGALGGAGIAYGLETREMLVLRTSALVVVIAAWYFGVEQGGALGAVGALAFTAALLFWLSGRVGRDDREASGEGGDPGAGAAGGPGAADPVT